MAKAKRTGRIVKVDFSKVKDGGGGGVRVKEGDYAATITAVELTESKAGDSMLVFSFKLGAGPASSAKGKVIKDRIVLLDTVLWKLRNLLEACGKEVPKKLVNLNIDKIIGSELGVTVVDGEEYKNRVNSEISEYMTLEELEDSEPDDEDEDEDEDEDDDEDTDDEELEELDVDDI